MRVYQPSPPSGCAWVMPVRKDDMDRLTFEGTPKTSGWEPVAMQFVTDSAGGDSKVTRDTSFPWFTDQALVVRQDAADRLGGTLSELGELLPLASDEADLSVFNCLTVQDVLDEKNSELVHFPSSGRFRKIARFAFDADRLTGLTVFKVKQWPHGPLLFTDAGIDELAKSGCGHMDFQILWDSDTGSFDREAEMDTLGQDRSI